MEIRSPDRCVQVFGWSIWPNTDTLNGIGSHLRFTEDDKIEIQAQGWCDEAWQEISS